MYASTASFNSAGVENALYWFSNLCRTVEGVCWRVVVGVSLSFSWILAIIGTISCSSTQTTANNPPNITLLFIMIYVHVVAVVDVVDGGDDNDDDDSIEE